LDNHTEGQYRIDESKFGRGVFVTQSITKGSSILKLTGPRISLQEVYRRGEHQCNPLQISNETYVCGILNDDTIIALRDIEAGEEIFYDYSTTISDDFEEDGSEFFMPCDCEDIQCRNKIGDFKYLSESKQQYYLSNNTVMSFIVEKA